MISHKEATILGAVPKDWGTVQLKRSLLSHLSGDWGDDIGDEELSVLRSTNFTDSRAPDFSDVAKRCFSAHHAARYSLMEGDILVERSGGSPNQPVGRVAYINENLPAFWFSNFVQLLRVNPDIMNPEFVAWSLYRLHCSGVVERLQHQTTQMRNLDFRDYLRVVLPKPPMWEQDRIVKAISLTVDAIQAAQCELHHARRVKTALLQQLLSKGLPKNQAVLERTKAGIIPATWDYDKLFRLGTMRAGGTPDRENPDHYDGSIPWVKSGEVNYNVIKQTEEHISENAASKIGGVFPVGTIVIAMYGAGITRGRVAILGVEAAVNQAVCSFQSNGRIVNEFLYYWFERNYQQVRALAGGSNQDNLNSFLLRRMFVPLPPDDEQREIASVLMQADKSIAEAVRRVEMAERLKLALLQSLLVGKVRLTAEVSA